jgi:hypothetical protein
MRITHEIRRFIHMMIEFIIELLTSLSFQYLTRYKLTAICIEEKLVGLITVIDDDEFLILQVEAMLLK